MQWIKAALVGALASLVMFIVIFAAIRSGMAPFNVPPSAAFLATLGLPIQPLGLLVHFGYGMFWSVVLVAIFRDRTDTSKGVGLALVLWAIMMLIYSPIIGWGFFGIGGSGHALSPEAQLYLGSGMKYIVATFVLHLVYGAIIGWGNRRWVDFGAI